MTSLPQIRAMRPMGNGLRDSQEMSDPYTQLRALTPVSEPPPERDDFGRPGLQRSTAGGGVTPVEVCLSAMSPSASLPQIDK